ncbi:MAG: amino acid-binding protein [Bacteroidales bacterium]|jgi:hypothetical protein|nr:amino acid-binding protein [Bacteroidales bacterium]MBR2748021.1 amino acid-binding protein [Bacteroidales bacterium]MBR3096994.1 amino acid-binding protein [Bacteroidales bacterium]MBR4688136.1 amino acid-binding protein [Bacteroidales bacterium]
MTIKQLSIFLENRSGTMTRVLDILKETGVRIIASSIADTAEYGLFRVICTDPQKAYDELAEAGVAVALSDVFAIRLDNRPGQVADTIKCFSDADISVIYMYSFMFHGQGLLIFRTDNTEEAREVIHRASLKSIAEKDLVDWE